MSRNHNFSREFPSISTHRCMANRHSVFGRQHLGRFVRVSAARIVSFVPVACGVVQASHKLLSVLPHLLVEPPEVTMVCDAVVCNLFSWDSHRECPLMPSAHAFPCLACSVRCC